MNDFSVVNKAIQQAMDALRIELNEVTKQMLTTAAEYILTQHLDANTAAIFLLKIRDNIR